MKSIKKLLRYVLGFLLVSSLSYAQDTEPEGEIHELSEFEVSGDAIHGYIGTETLAGATTVGRLIDIPQNISIVTRDVMTDLTTQDIREALEYASPGVTTLSSGSLNINIRGFRAGEGTIDGSRNFMRQQNNSYNVDRMEVIKGPAALLYGDTSNAGGHINIVTKKPQREFQGELMFSIGDADLYEGMVDVTGPVKGIEDIQYRIVAGAREKGSNFDPYNHNDSLIFAPTFAFDAGKRTRIIVRYEYNFSSQLRSRTVIDPDTLKPLRGFNNEGIINVIGRDPFSGVEEATTHFGVVNVDSKLGDNWDFEANYRYMEFKRDRDQSVMQGNDPAEEYTYFLNFNTERLWSHYARMRLAHTARLLEGDLRLKTVIGGEGDFRHFKRDTWQTLTADRVLFSIEDIRAGNFPEMPNPTFNNGRNSDDAISGGVYVQETISMLKDKLIFTLGTRRNFTESTSVRFLAGDDPGTKDNPNPSNRAPVDIGPTVTNSHQTYRWGVVGKPTEWMSIFAGHTESFQPAGLGRIYDGSPDGTREAPRSRENFEVGAKFELASLIGTISYFDTDESGATRSDPDHFGFFIQDGLTNNKGIDFSVAYVRKGLSLVAGYYKGDVKNVLSGARPPATPNKTANILAKYEFQEGGLKGLTIGGATRYYGGALANAGSLQIESYWRSDIFLKYLWKNNVEFAFNIKNVADDDHIYLLSRASLIELYDPREFQFTVRYRF